MLQGFFRAARELAVPMADVRRQLNRWLDAEEPERFVLIEADAELCKILAAELRAMTAVPVDTCSPIECGGNASILERAVPLCRPSRKLAVESALPAGTELVVLSLNSVPAWMAPVVEAACKGELLAVVSHWPAFLETSRTMLLAAGVPEDALLFCDAREEHGRGLELAGAVLCDAFTASALRLTKQATLHVFPLLAASTESLLAAHIAG